MNWRTLEKQKIKELNAYADALERRERRLIEALTLLVEGYGRKVEGRDWSEAMRKLAADKLSEIAFIRVPARPWL